MQENWKQNIIKHSMTIWQYKKDRSCDKKYTWENSKHMSEGTKKPENTGSIFLVIQNEPVKTVSRIFWEAKH